MPFQKFSPAMLLLTAFVAVAVAGQAPAQATGAELDGVVASYRTAGAEQALPQFERLLSAYTESGDVANAARAERYVGESHWRLGNYERAAVHLERALGTMRQLDQKRGEGKVLNVLGLLEWDLGHYDSAMSHFRAASRIGMELGDRRLAGATMNNLGLVLDELGDYRSSLEHYRRALELYEGADFARGESDTLGNIGGVHLLLGQYHEALAYYQRALRISETLAARASLSLDHGNLALCYLGLGRLEDALRHFDLALAFAAEAGMRKEEALWQSGKGSAFIRKGQYDLGLEVHRAALATYEEINARTLLAEALHDMGRLHLDLGDPLSAEQYFIRALEMAREMGQQQTVSAALLSLGDLHARRENLERAEAMYREALARTNAAGELTHEAWSRLSLAEVQRSREQFEAAETEARQALAIAEQAGAAWLHAEAWYAIAEALRNRGQSDAALQAYQKAQTGLGQTGDPGLLWKIHHGRARALLQSGQRHSAAAELQAAVQVIESVREQVREERFKAGYLQDKYQVYVDLVRLQLELGQVQQAFSVAERLRSRSFFDQLAKGGPLIRNETERQRNFALRERVRQLQSALEKERQLPSPARRQLAIDTFSSELLLAEREYQAFLDDHRQRTGDGLAADVPPLPDMQARLQPDEALVEYVVDSDRVMIFVLRSNGLAAVTEDIRYVDLEAKVLLVRELMQSPGSADWRQPAASLADALIEPLRRQALLAGITQLYLVPHGILNYLPFAALPLGGAADSPAVIERYTLSYLPAGALLAKRPNEPSRRPSLLALAPANSRLKYAMAEARSITALYQPNALLLSGVAATESAFKAQAGDYEMLHLSTHGFFNAHNPLLSGLSLEPDLSNDGRLEVHEILGLSLKASLVTLSACVTGLGSGYFNALPAGDEFVGLTRAFLLAGSQSVLSTLWEVDDRSTVELMHGFYGQEQSGHAENPAQSLAYIQRGLRRSAEFNHPFYWAAFVLVGIPSQRPGSRI
jgi:CHAT domain-containing protein/tetratricopeptide (TPR) repeat protein